MSANGLYKTLKFIWFSNRTKPCFRNGSENNLKIDINIVTVIKFNAHCIAIEQLDYVTVYVDIRCASRR